MPSRRRRAAAAPFLALSVGAGISVLLLHAVFVGTEPGQRLDDAGRRLLPSGVLAPADQASQRLLDTISVSSLALLGIGIMLVAVLRDRLRLAIGAGAMVLGANLTTQWAKATFDHPDLVEGFGTTPGSFPSGHVTVAASLAFALVLVAPPTVRWPAAFVGFAYAAAVGVAVLALGWHRPSDVVGAYCVVVAWTGLVAAALIATRGPAELGASAGRPRRAGAVVTVVLGAAFMIVVAVQAQRRLDVSRVVDDRTTLAAAAAVCVVACAGLVILVTSMLQALRTSRPRRRPG